MSFKYLEKFRKKFEIKHKIQSIKIFSSYAMFLREKIPKIKIRFYVLKCLSHIF
jgi:hypothetical protein